MKRFVFLVIAFLSLQAFAGETQGKIQSIWVHGYNDTVLISLVTTQPNLAPCAVTGRYAISTSTQQGKNIMSTILFAKASNQTVAVGGRNTCSVHGDAEDINAIVII